MLNYIFSHLKLRRYESESLLFVALAGCLNHVGSFGANISNAVSAISVFMDQNDYIR